MREFVGEPQPVEIRDVTLGLNTTESIEDFSPGEALVARNVDPSFGTFAKRYGCVQIGDRAHDSVCHWGPYHYRARDGTTEFLLRVQAKRLYKLTGANWLGAISGTNPGDGRDLFGGGNRRGTAIQYVDRIYYCDGDAASRYDPGAGTIRPWSFAGGAMPAATMSGPSAGGSKGVGNYATVWTLYDSSVGDETNPSAESLAITTTLGNNTITATINQPPGYTANYDKVRIYSTTLNGAGAWYFEVEVAATFPVVVALSAADSNLQNEVEYDNDPIPTGAYVVIMHDERAIILSLNSSTVYWSKKGKPWSVPTANGQDLLKDDGHPATGLFILYGNVYAWKRGGPGFQLTPHPTLGYAPQQLPAKGGCESHHSIVVDVNEAFWADSDGILLFNGQQTANVSDPKIRQTFKEIAQSASSLLENAVGVAEREADRPYFRWSFSHPSEPGANRHLLLYRPQGAQGPLSWFEETYPGGISGLRSLGIKQATNRQLFTYAADANGYAYRLRSNEAGVNVYSDNGAGIDFEWQSGWLGNGVISSLCHWVDVVVERSDAGVGAGVVTLQVWANGESSPIHTKDIPLTDGGPLTFTVRVELPQNYWERISVGVANDDPDVDVSITKFVIWQTEVGDARVAV